MLLFLNYLDNNKEAHYYIVIKLLIYDCKIVPIFYLTVCCMHIFILIVPTLKT